MILLHFIETNNIPIPISFIMAFAHWGGAIIYESLQLSHHLKQQNIKTTTTTNFLVWLLVLSNHANSHTVIKDTLWRM